MRSSSGAILTERYAIRSGNASIPIETSVYGLTQWVYTMAEMLSDVGYAKEMFGQLHLDRTEGRYPTDQGFDEWYGIPTSSDTSTWPTDCGIYWSAFFRLEIEDDQGRVSWGYLGRKRKVTGRSSPTRFSSNSKKNTRE